MHLGSLELGPFRVDAIDGGSVWMDGGAMFGVVPKTLWSKLVTADAENRVRLGFFSLLVRSGDATVVIEAGSAAHEPPRMAAYHKADRSSLVETLASLGVEVGDVDYFIPSHLHFDHVGGAVEGAHGPTFPAAQYVIQKAEWEEAKKPMAINRNAYLPGDIEPLRSARLRIVDGSAEIIPGVAVRKSGAHSAGHQVVTVGMKASGRLVFTGDIIPTSEHISPRWMCAFDLFPVETYECKVDILARAADEGTLVAPGHGGAMPICTIRRTSDDKFAGERVLSISPPAW